MNKKVLILGLLILIVPVLILISLSPKTSTPVKETDKEPIAYECNGDGFICPDGSVVGRTGKDCKFSACPMSNATSSKIITSLGQVTTGLNVSVTPKEIVSDSRCPEGVQCIWAGTVEVKTILATKVAHGEHILTLDKPQTFGEHIVTLVEVTPEPKEGIKIPGSSYKFTFDVKKR